MKCVNSFKKREKWENPHFIASTNEVGRKFLLFLFAILSFTVINAQIVSLGNDVAICKGSDALLSDFNPVNTVNGGKSWGTSGDGVFNTDASYANAVTYIPGVNDISNGSVIITLYGIQGILYQDQAILYIQDDVLFACNDNVILPLNFYCEYLVTPPMLLEGEDADVPYTLYDVEIFDADGNIIPNDIVTGEFIGQTLTYKVRHECSWNACSGTISIQDNYHPITDCGNDTITCKYSTEPEYVGFPFDASIFTIDTIYRDTTVNNKFTVEGWDACGDVILTYDDETFEYMCLDDSIFQKLIVRSWIAVDQSDNVSTCIDSIFVERIPIDSVLLPRDWNNIDTTALQCDGIWLTTALPNGNPSPEHTGWPEKWGCNIEYNFIDSEFPSCGNNFDVIRKWTIIDWCNPLNILHYTQVIKIMDTLAPVLVCTDDTVIVSADPYDCNSGLYYLNMPDITDNCSSTSLFVHVYDDFSNEEVNVIQFGGVFNVDDLPLGRYRVEYTAIDECNNIGECDYYFDVIDDQRPYAVCDQHTKVNLGSNGEARLFPENIDDGSYDNCGIVDMKIRKMTYDCDSSYFEFGEFIGFCCEESNTTIMVAILITDAAGNSNSCMVEVIVEDKLPPQIICPPDITISCDFYFNPDDLDRYFGKVVTDESLREDIIINDLYNNGVVGRDGLAYDNCDVIIIPTEEFDVNNCNIGTIYRTFTAQDNGGRTNPCLQTITIYNPEPFNYYGDDIEWPIDTTFIGCSNLDADTSITGAPIVNDNMCSMVAIRYDDQMFSVQIGACEKIIRTWTVRDWCQDGAVWTYEQIIMLNNEEAPTFTSDCFDREICVYGECSGLVELSASATDDCTAPEELSWRWKLDRDGDGFFDEFGQGNHFSKTLYEGIYEIVWVVEDRCGNESHCDYIFTVKDCKNPTPLCISDITTVVMNQVGMVTVVADIFNHGSYDNCTPSNYGACGCETDLLFSFSEDITDTLFNITCDSLINGVARTFYLDMWVTDNAGNQDFCSVYLQVQDNNGVCDDTDGIVMSGLMKKWSDDKLVKNIDVQLQDTKPETSDQESKSIGNGRFIFENLPSNESYTIKGMDDESNCLMGVSTFDIVAIQKHILGIKKFDSPYQYIAADANKTNSISAADILEVRKLILGSSNDFSKNTCWIYVDAKQSLSTYSPYNYKSELNYPNLINSVNDADFKVVKVGDVNDSYNPQQMPQNLIPRNDEFVSLELDNVELIKGNEYKVPVYIVSDNGIAGIQFTMGFDMENVSYEGYENAQIDLGDYNFGYNFINDGIVTFSWNTSSYQNYKSDTPLFYMLFKAIGNSSVSQSININNDITSALSITEDKEVPLVLNYRNGDNTNEFTVYQNTPNPFNDKTTIKFNLPENETVALEVFDINGRLVYTKTEEFEKGINHFEVTSLDINKNGVFYYNLKIAGNAVTKKMIFID